MCELLELRTQYTHLVDFQYYIGVLKKEDTVIDCRNQYVEGGGYYRHFNIEDLTKVFIEIRNFGIARDLN